ncbi:MAG: 2-amino-4-hydroxy-6-hydroxymethyldihydropteridine diphosphokinase [Mariniblastus sp.]
METAKPDSPNANEATLFDCLIAFGSNLGDGGQIFKQTIQLLNANQSINVVSKSELQTTRPVGGPAGQDAYLNAAIRIEASCSPSELHSQLVEIESELGRIRHERWGARRVDLDLLLYGQESILTDRLIVPHPRMSFRRFVLDPAHEIAGDMIHPVSGQSIRELVSHLDQAERLVLLVSSNANSQIPESLAKRLIAALSEAKVESGSGIGSDVEIPPESKAVKKDSANWQFKVLRSANDLMAFSNFDQTKLRPKGSAKEKPDSESLLAQTSIQMPILVCHFSDENDNARKVSLEKIPDPSKRDPKYDSQQQLQMAAVNFAGPTLELKNDEERAFVEVMAAIEAMSKD